MFDQDHEIKIGEAIINQFNVMYGVEVTALMMTSFC
jgi:hypothetical protein